MNDPALSGPSDMGARSPRAAHRKAVLALGFDIEPLWGSGRKV